jgi:hypothetical protein
MEGSRRAAHPAETWRICAKKIEEKNAPPSKNTMMPARTHIG